MSDHDSNTSTILPSPWQLSFCRQPVPDNRPPAEWTKHGDHPNSIVLREENNSEAWIRTDNNIVPVDP